MGDTKSAMIREAPRLLKDNLSSVENQGRMRIRIIEGDRWGSSGYYAKEMLKRDGAKAFPAGTHMYINHPSESEEWDRPERDIRDLAGVLETDAVYEKGDLFADVKVYSHWAPLIRETAEDIGVSIRALAKGQEGEREGRTGLIFTELVEGISVDYVTQAGAGGKVVQLFESARKTSEALNANRQTQVTKALQAMYPGEDAWVIDLDEDSKIAYYTVWRSGQGAKTYAHKYVPANDDNSVSFSGDPEEVMRQTNYVPVPATQTSTTTTTAESDKPKEESKPDPVKENKMGETTIQESELTRLRESASRAETLETELKESREEGRKAAVYGAKEHRRANREQARRVVADVLHEAGIKAPSLASAFASDPPLIEEGKDNAGTVDEAKLKEQVKEAIGEIQVDLDESTGGVRGFGASKGGSDTEISEADLDKMAAGIFDREEVKG